MEVVSHTYIKNLLVAIQNDFFSSGTLKKVEIVKQSADGSFTPIVFFSPSCLEKNIRLETLNKFKPLLMLDKLKTREVLLHKDHKKSLVGSFIQEVRTAITLSFFSSNIDNKIFINRHLENSAIEIFNWLQSTDDRFDIYVRLLNKFSHTNLDKWECKILDLDEKSLLAHFSGIPAEEFLYRLFNSTVYKAILPENISFKETVEYVDGFTLALFLATWRPLHIDDVYIEHHEWKKCPFLPFYFHRMHGVYKYSVSDACLVDFKSSCDSKQFPRPEVVDKSFLDKATLLIEKHPEFRYPIKKIMRGIWSIYSSSNEPSFLKESQAERGIHDILIGLDGLIMEPVEGRGQRAYFEKMWIYILKNTAYEKNLGQKSDKKIAKRLYDLRCELAHGSNKTIEEKLAKLSIAINDEIREELVNSKVVGSLLASLLKRVFREICLSETLSILDTESAWHEI